MSNAVERVRALGQSVWYDNIRRGLIESGELQRLIDVGVTGLTSNPTIFEKAIAGSTDYDDDLIALAREDRSAEEILEALAMDDIRAAADLLRPIYDATGGQDGYASLEVSPHLAHDTGGTVEEAARLFDALDRPNVMIKIPATPEGIPAVREAIGCGINVNVTLIFSRDAYSRVREAYMSGLEDLARSSGDVGGVSSVASFFVSRVDTAVDALLEPRASEGDGQCSELLGTIAVANAKLAYQAFEESFDSDRFAPLRAAGARVQRPLWASTGTKNPDYSDVLYIDSLIGPDTVNTMPDGTLTAFLEHGAPVRTIDEEVDGARRAVESLPEAGIDLDQITDRLLADGVKAFADSYDQLLSNIEEKVAALRSRERVRAAAPLSDGLQLAAALDELESEGVVSRIWSRDGAVWGADGTADGLGWLTVTDAMREQLPALRQLAEEVRQEGVRRLLLLGMGGSVLGPEVLCRTLGSAGYPALDVLDSTIPSVVRDTAHGLDPEKTLLLVSSKSGETVETRSLYAYFSGLVSTATGDAGGRSVAITDAGTPLHSMANERGFRRLFLNPPDIGGRYSVLSYFGLVPAALAGVEIETLLDRADGMREMCGPAAPTATNPGARLGVAIGAMATRGPRQADAGLLPLPGGAGAMGGAARRGEHRQGRPRGCPCDRGAAARSRAVRRRPFLHIYAPRRRRQPGHGRGRSLHRVFGVSGRAVGDARRARPGSRAVQVEVRHGGRRRADRRQSLRPARRGEREETDGADASRLRVRRLDPGCGSGPVAGGAPLRCG